MAALETRIKYSLRDKGIPCHTVYRMPDPDEQRVLIAFKSNGGQKLTTNRVERILNTLNLGEFKVEGDFQRLSAQFLHLEVKLGVKTESPIMRSAE
jgi:hypothetical protein